MFWKQLNKTEIRKRIFTALSHNINYDSESLIGVPASYLDKNQFNTQHPILREAPFLMTMIHNPNHIGCHTLTQDQSEEYFKGTQDIELELLELLATQVFRAEEKSTDGYIAPGGTEANIQAQWIYRNYFQYEFEAKPSEIGLLYSADAHYSMPKGANLLGIQNLVVRVDEDDRSIDLEHLMEILHEARESGIKHLIVNLNMATTMFGSVDNIDEVCKILDAEKWNYKVHVDAAFGGFIYPFTNENYMLNFNHPKVNSITVDGHKMLQAPYGTGIFLIRKGWMKYTTTQEAKYVSGLDSTLCGSRSGANAIAMWMIVMGYGSEGWKENCSELLSRTDYLCENLVELGIPFYRNPKMNIVTIKADYLPQELAHQYHLVADDHENPKWYKVVVMPHVSKETLSRLLNKLRLQLWIEA